MFQQCRQFNTSLSYSSSCVSASEFFDAEDLPGAKSQAGGDLRVQGDDERVRGSDTSSEAGSLTSEEGSVSSESDLGHDFNTVNSSKCLIIFSFICLLPDKKQIIQTRPYKEEILVVEGRSKFPKSSSI